jgi:hypothetical protein
VFPIVHHHSLKSSGDFNSPAKYPHCDDNLSLSGWAYTRPFPPPHDYGRPGLAHRTLHGAVHHRASEIEIWEQTFEPGWFPT